MLDEFEVPQEVLLGIERGLRESGEKQHALLVDVGGEDQVP